MERATMEREDAIVEISIEGDGSIEDLVGRIETKPIYWFNT